MRVLIIGSGGREHAIGKALYESPSAEALDLQLYHIGPYRNYGLHEINFLLHRKRNIEFTPEKMHYFAQFNLTPECKSDIVKQAQTWQIDLAIIGPEAGLAMGLVDSLEKVGIACVGPTKRLAEIETSKLAARHILEDLELGRYNPIYRDIYNTAELVSFIKNNQYVIKADGLRGGKGVKLSGEHLNSIAEATAYCEELIAADGFCLVEDKLTGYDPAQPATAAEFSLITFSDGNSWVHGPPIQDYKRAGVNDTGPNTGGMGCVICPYKLPFLTVTELAEAQAVNEAVLRYLNSQETRGYRGFLYGSFIKTPRGLKVIEFNARLGDPEALLLLKVLDQGPTDRDEPTNRDGPTDRDGPGKSDFLQICLAMATGQLSQQVVSFRPEYGLALYLCPRGYPDNFIFSEAKNLDSTVDLCDNFPWVYAAIEPFQPELFGTFTLLESPTGLSKGQISSSRGTGSRAAAQVISFEITSDTVSIDDLDVFEVILGNNITSNSGKLFARLDLIDRFKRMLLSPTIQSSSLFNMESESESNSDMESNSEMESETELNSEMESESKMESELNLSAQASALTYQSAGVNRDEATRAKLKIKSLVQATHTSRVVPNYGAFGGLWDIDDGHYLAISTDGLGTKIELVLDHIYQDTNRLIGFQNLGRDLLAANLNDVLCLGSGLEPMCITDYFSASVLKAEELTAFIEGLSQSCQEVGCALIGGETAELKTHNWRETNHNQYEMVGQIVAKLPKAGLYRPDSCRAGDLVVGLRSSGPHTNGYTLINQLWRAGYLREHQQTLIEPHRIYFNQIKQLEAAGVAIKAVARITGGGLIENPPRVLPPDLEIQFNYQASHWPEVFKEIQRLAQITDYEMMRTFNCGIGLIIVIDPSELAKVLKA